ncbi:Rrf2 family transcriptional regulator [Paenibacillus sp. S150]|uniref:RrF2 family transcriptional regulator n=1 Tax=Paenibacillus sp. S150 TaxID=2749826 RepID=UPI001C59DCD1|nr:Rrf2 family transcriptional regulator [Paenibacillus sp. S150]MBW4084399.1 Rrf2 family transcriptional regulator [Paenibacillus sp. S150]
MTKTRNSGALQYKSFGLVLQALVIIARKEGITCSSCEIAGYLSSEPTVLRKALAKLTKEGILATREGRDGGFMLNRSPEELTLAEIYHAMEVGGLRSNGVKETMCENVFGQQMKNACGDILEEMDQSAVGVLRKYTLAELVRRTEC